MKKANKALKANKDTWDEVAELFRWGSALPYWGPYRICQNNKKLIGTIKDKTFLEVGFGSGKSISYLMKNGAKKVYALDISEEQVKIAEENNRKWVDDGRVKLIASEMEKKIKLPEKVDTIYSIYAIGWTLDHENTLKNIYSYLKKGGRFVWSWEHPDFNRTAWEKGKVVYEYSYFDKDLYHIKSWKKSKKGAYMYPRTVSFWFQALQKVGFAVVDYLEPEPEYFKPKEKNAKGENLYYYYKKAKTVPNTMIFVCEKR